METLWDIHQPDSERVAELQRALNLNPLAATLLVNRGIRSVEHARRFLDSSLADIKAPPEVKDIAIAAGRIARALETGEKILIFGDYDVDGVTGTALLLDFLGQAGARVDHHIPHRRREGYGLKVEHIAAVAVPGAYKLIITVDCGISSHAAVEAARRNGIDVIVTDHHTPDEGPLPAALAVVNPKRQDCPACLEHLAGVGMAFYLLIQLRAHLREEGFWKDRSEPNLKHLCDLVALGTVADMVPLVKENRTFTQAGLELLSTSRRPGLQALMAASRIDSRRIEADDISFRLAPRINAAGRMAHADLAVDLLTTEDPDEARRLARRLDELNRQRRSIEQDIVERIIAGLEGDARHLQRPAILLLGSDWHEGVLGIVAARLMRRYAKPVILVAANGDTARGSGRSTTGLDIFALLQECADLLEAYGGHAMAVGMTIAVDRWEDFRQRFWQVLESRPEHAATGPRLDIDMELTLDAVDRALFDTLDRLKPFGQKVPEPVFMARDVEIVSQQMVGGRHRRMRLRSRGADARRIVPAIQFNVGEDHTLPDRLQRIAFHVRRHTWNGADGHQLHVIATRA
ncbi:MAG: single-stranded-DNA-specific exonuclease RecJ [Desulfobacterales bacterium]|nr:single-stranded-DNA-specific exonuclease RecJ [Desulfobacterales bacterium]